MDVDWRGQRLRIVNTYAPADPGGRRELFSELPVVFLTNRLLEWRKYTFRSKLQGLEEDEKCTREEDILCFLLRYCDDVREGVKLKDKYGFWNGKRRFLVRFKRDSLGVGGFAHPPGAFAIGPDRGYLWYPGQPVYCRRCGSFGHIKEVCTCRHCLAGDHETKDCVAPKTCNLCGSSDHLFRGCPDRRRSFASLFQADFADLGGVVRRARVKAPPGGTAVANTFGAPDPVGWEVAKFRFRVFCQRYGALVRRRERAEVRKWMGSLSYLHGQLNAGVVVDWAVYEGVKGKIRGLMEERSRALAFQARVQEMEEGEKPSAFFFQAMEARCKDSVVTGLRGANGLVTEAQPMMPAAEAYYAELFRTRDCDPEAQKTLVDMVKARLGVEEAQALDAPLSLVEVAEAMRSLKDGRAPGCDGLPKEFFATFWDLLGQDLMEVGGVRQGCPLSPLLYVLFMEPFAELVRRDSRIDGVHIPGAGGERLKIQQYADDTTLFVSSIYSLRRIWALKNLYEAGTGSKVNVVPHAEILSPVYQAVVRFMRQCPSLVGRDILMHHRAWYAALVSRQEAPASTVPAGVDWRKLSGGRAPGVVRDLNWRCALGRLPSVPRAGLRNTVRFQWRADGGIMPREAFGRAVLLGALNLKMEDVLCFQTNTLEKAYDITLSTSEVCLRVLEECRRRVAEKPVAFFEVMSLDRPNFRLITVHMYNPHVSDQAVAAFLRSFGEVLTEARRRYDSLGFWTGKRQFQVLLRPDLEGWEGLAHPPALFSIGADRGY
ncbi:hypothetical protein SKAU_G00387280 [Synaphobranchus kaupii]|uniref:CCHC-type domain-containing protein n=1 Tax=Synaphobranchus kaupii TaxID=118154 RepID=A0A9Q1ID97_SYNKA|nr:hypothetical protein SKAU_G00387280 [Synaphobranchus kaupii]